MGHTLMLNYEQYISSCRHVFATMSFIAETFIFLYVGMDALDIEKWKIYDQITVLILSSYNLAWLHYQNLIIRMVSYNKIKY